MKCSSRLAPTVEDIILDGAERQRRRADAARRRKTLCHRVVIRHRRYIGGDGLLMEPYPNLWVWLVGGPPLHRGWWINQAGEWAHM